MEEVPLGCQNTANKLVVKFKGYRDIPIPFHLDTGPASATTSATAVGTPEVMKSVADANIVLGPLFQDLIQVEEASSLSSPINPTPSITLKSNPVPPRVLQQISLDKPFQVTKRKVFDLPRLKDLVQGAEVTSSSLLTCPSPSSALTFDSVPRTAFQELPLKSSSVSSGSNSYEFSSNHLKQMIQRIRNPGIMRTGSENKNNILEQDLYSLSVMPDSCIASFKVKTHVAGVNHFLLNIFFYNRISRDLRLWKRLQVMTALLTVSFISQKLCWRDSATQPDCNHHLVVTAERCHDSWQPQLASFL